MRAFLTALFTLFVLCSFAQQDPYLKKLGVREDGSSTGIGKSTIDKLNKTIMDSVYTNATKASKYSHINYRIATKVEYADGQVESLINLCRAKIYLNQFDSAGMYIEIAMSIATKSNSSELIVKTHEMKGNIHSYNQEYAKATKSYFEAIKIAEKIDPELALTSYVNLGHVYKQIGNVKKYKEYALKSYNLSKKYKDTAVALTALNHLGIITKNEGDLEGAINYYEEGLGYAKATNNLKGQAEIMYNMSNIFFKQGLTDKGFEYFNKSMDISKGDDTHFNNALGYYTLALHYFEIGRYADAQKASDLALEYALLSKNYEILTETYNQQSEIAEKRNDKKSAISFLRIAFQYKDSLKSTELNDVMKEAEDLYKEEKKAYNDSITKIQESVKAENEKKINEERLKSREMLLWIAGFALILVLIGLYKLNKNNKIVKAKNVIVEKQKMEIETQHQEITDSINYAQRIQAALISNEVEWKKVSEDSFVLFKPKDVVSGDFYWAHNIKDKNVAVWAVADCTGHGVPGAFMSMLGIGFLNEIVIEGNTIDPGEILTRLRTKIVGALTKDNEAHTKDGMDISLCIWDKNDNTLHYAGANNPLWLIRSTEHELPERFKSTTTENNLNLIEISGDKMPIGYQLAHPPPFMSKKIQLIKDDIIVLFSDGYADQFGGEHGKKLKYKTFKELLLKYQRDRFADQGDMLDDAFENWRGEHEQIDDVCVVGVKVNA